MRPSGSRGVFWLANNDLGTRSVRKTSKSSQPVIPRFRFPRSRITSPSKITVQGVKVVLFKPENASGPETHAVETGRRPTAGSMPKPSERVPHAPEP